MSLMLATRFCEMSVMLRGVEICEHNIGRSGAGHGGLDSWPRTSQTA